MFKAEKPRGITRDYISGIRLRPLHREYARMRPCLF